ncbi:MAG: hypothetical protein Kow009_08090 [Spirochaetales bacterium]
MKKLIILSLIALLASGMAFAQVSLSGQIQYEVADDFDNPGVVKSDPDTQIKVNVKDDYNSGMIRLRVRKEDTTGTTGKWVDYDRAYFTTDVLGGLGVKDAPVAVYNTIGLNEFAPAYVGNVNWDIVKGVTVNKNYWTSYGLMPKVSIMKMVDVAAAFDLTSDTLKKFFTDVVVSLPAGPGALKVEGTYGVNGTSDFGEGYFLAQLAYAMKVGDIGLNLGGAYNAELADTGISGYGFGVKADMGMAYGFVGLQGAMKNDDAGYDGEALHNVRLAAGVKPVPFFGLDAGVILYTGSEDSVGTDNEVLNTLDISGVLYVGKASWRIGYILTPDGDNSIDPYQTDAATKGLYLVGTLAF